MATLPYEWYQSHTGVTISFFIRDLDEFATKCTLSSDNSTLMVKLVKPGKGVLGEHTLPLYDTVSSVILTVSNIRAEIKLTKATQKVTWPTLVRAPGAAPLTTTTTTQGAEGAPTPPASAAPPAAPSGGGGGGGGGSGSGSSESGGGGGGGGAQPAPPAPPPQAKPKKDWSQLEAEADAEDAKPEGEEALMSLFRNIFKGGSEETRKAMVKSFQTSGGTVLSTNWGEVEKTDYEKEKDKLAGGGGGGGASETGEKK